MRYFIIIFLFLGACIQKKESHSHEHSHTQKLMRPLSIAFLSKDEVVVKMNATGFESLDLLIYHQVGERKTVIYQENIALEDGAIRFNLSDELDELGGILAAVVKGYDKNNQPVSASASYILGEQEEINSAKQLILEN